MIKLFYVESGLLSYAGHVFNTSKVLIDEFHKSEKFSEILYIGDSSCEPEIKKFFNFHDFFTKSPKNSSKSGWHLLLFELRSVIYIFKGLLKTRDLINYEVQNLYYLNTALSSHLLAIFFFLLIKPRKAKLKFILTLRLSTYFAGRKSKRYTLYLLSLNLLKLFKKSVIFTTDSELLETEYSTNFDIKVTTLCIPHIIDFDIKPVRDPDEIVIGIIGPSRNYKGVTEALEALLIIDKNNISKIKKITLILHSFGELSAQLNLMAEKFTNIHVNVRRDPLSNDDYNKDIRLCDLILLNYDPAMYQRNTSGIFFEAICLGKNVIATENTWMAYQNSKFNLCFVIKNEVTELVSTIVSYINIPFMVREKIFFEGKESFRKLHSPKIFTKNFMELI